MSRSVQVDGEAQEYQLRVRQWLVEQIDAVNAASDDPLVRARAFQAALHQEGYAGIAWPKEWGGQGLGMLQAQLFNTAAKSLDLPNRVLAIGLNMVAPTLLELGTDQQKRRHVEAIARGDQAWCQLFSEPSAGSDLASLRTLATKVDGGWLFTGQKVWTSVAQYADFGILLARTDPEQPKHRGITMFILDMHQQGVQVRPLVDMTGHAPFNEVFLEDAFAPDEAVIGGVDRGWEATVAMLKHERLAISGTRQPRSRGLAFSALAEQSRLHGTSADPVVRDKLAEVLVNERALELFNLRMRQEIEAGAPAGSRASVGKLAGALQLVRAAEATAAVVGKSVVSWVESDHGMEELALGINSALADSIAGGTNEIQRSIIGERILGLPKEPGVDPMTPFSRLLSQ